MAVTFDNASNNDTQVKALQKSVPGFLEHVRCFLHIVNLAAKGIIKPLSTPASSLDMSSTERAEEDSEELEDEQDFSDREDDPDPMSPGDTGVQQAIVSDMDLEKVSDALGKVCPLLYFVFGVSWYILLDSCNCYQGSQVNHSASARMEKKCCNS